MRTLALTIALLSMPAFAADYSPWATGDSAAGRSQRLAQTSDGYCCRHCTKNEQPCGHLCINRRDTCSLKPGCACPWDGR